MQWTEIEVGGMRNDRAPRLAEAQLFHNQPNVADTVFYNQPTLALLADTFGGLMLGN